MTARMRSAGSFASLLCGLLLAGCSDEPTLNNALTSSLPLEGFAAYDTTIAADTSTTFRKYVAMNGATNMLGMADGYTAMAAIQFVPGYFPRRDTATVFRATLTLTTVTWMGDSLGTLGFTVHRIDKSWSTSRLTWDSVYSGFYDPAVVRGSYMGGPAADRDTISVELDTAMVREWLQSTSTNKYGIILVPTPSSTIVRGLYPFELDSVSWRPTVTIYAGNAAGTSLDTTRYNVGADTFVGNIDNLATDPALFYLQAGVVYRSTLHFPTSFIPRGAIINSAELTIDRDPAASRLSRFVVDSLVTAHLLLSADPTGIFESDYTATAGRPKAGTSTSFSFDLRHAAQAWVKGTNDGILLRNNSVREFSSFDLYAFAGPRHPDPARRPRLHLVYSVRKEK